MAKLIYSMIGSLDGYIADANGNFDWAEPDEEILAYINAQERPIGTYLYGRRIYELMTVWETDPDSVADSPAAKEYAEIWQAASKIVYSTSLQDITTTKTRLERSFEPAAVEELKRTASADIGIGGPTLGVQAFRAGLIDEVYLLLLPVIIGGGLSLFPGDVRLDLQLKDTRRFANGTLALQYDVGR
ncbi:dihydrofolate reductase family protein [Arthrobacter tecti]